MFRSTLQLNHIPSAWREVKVIFIPKAGRSSHTKPKDFRPISLSSYLLKTLERLIDISIRNNIPHSRLSKSQHAYCKGKSTETALNSLITSIEGSFEIKEYTLAAFLDIEGAFNNILPKVITDTLSDLGISGAFVNFIEQLLICRFVNSTLGASAMRRSVCRGTPQGGVLSPLLWNLTMNKLLLELEERGIQVVAYADDVAIVLRGKFPDTLCSLMQGTIKYIDTWAKTCGLGLNAAKTELVLFTKKYKIPDLRPPTLNGTVLQIGDKASYLGLTLDRKLSWKLNVQDRVKKAATALYSCKRTVGLKWGLAPKIVHWLYTAIVRPILTYGVLVWWPALEKKSSIRRLDSIQRAASLSITGALKTTPTSALNVMLHLLPIDLYCKQIAAKAALRLRESSMLKINNQGHSRILGMFPGIPKITDYCEPVDICLERPYMVHFPSREDWENGKINVENGVSIYTDGSKLNDQVGCGVYSKATGTNLSLRLPDHCSVFQAEVSAISESLLVLNKSVVTAREIFIYSDSQAALKSLLSCKHSSRTVKECYELLKILAEYFSINLLWVPGHSNIEGNCEADGLARLGSSLQISQDKVDIHMPLATCKLIIDKHTMSVANSSWKHLGTCAISRQTWPEWNMGRTKNLLKLNRKDLRNVVGVLSGHCLIGRHASRLGAPSHDYCRSCQDIEEEETVEHLLCGCMALCRRRLRLLGLAFLDNIEDVGNLKLACIASFLKATQWFKEDQLE